MLIDTMDGLPIQTTHDLIGEEWVMKPEYAILARAANEKQLETWLAGKPEHNDFAGECCPDFSCCNPKLMWPLSSREAFAKAHREGRSEVVHQMLVGALSGIANAAVEEIGNPEIKIHVAGEDVSPTIN